MVRSMLLALVLVACTDPTPSETGDTADSGTTPPTTSNSFVQSDVFTQAPLDPIDFVWMLDANWPDGYDQLQNVRRTGYETLLLADSDWKMGFTATEAKNPSTRGIIRGIHQSVFPDPGTWTPPSGDDVSKPVDALIAMLDERADTNEEFYREGHLHVMIMTDSRDRSDSSLQDLRRAIEEHVDDQLTQSVRISAIVRGSQELVNTWRDFTDDFGGLTYVAGSWERGITDLYNHGVNRRREFTLTETPLRAPSTVIVRHRDHNTLYTVGKDIDYIATRNVIRFLEDPPEMGATVRVEYPVSNN